MPVALELLAPARNKDIGIAAIDCGADAVYIAGPAFGAREAAGNSFQDIAALTSYAHRFGAKIYLTLNTILYEHELEKAREHIFRAVEAGCDALIIQDLGILKMSIPPIELHASTQCNIRTVEQARFLESLGFRKLVLARELSTEQIKDIAGAVSCDIECFIHGALCVSYSGQCWLSQYLAGRSANRGCCIQACRSRYDVLDQQGRMLLHNKPVLSLKDLSLHDRISQMVEAGATSFKIEGRLKNISYVRNIVRMYSGIMDDIIAAGEGHLCRSSWGSPHGGFTPLPSATFSRGSTRYFADGNRDRWCSSDYAKSVGEYVGEAVGILSCGKDSLTFEIHPADSLSVPIGNGDGLCVIGKNGNVSGMRAGKADGNIITCGYNPDLRPGSRIYRNYNQAFEKTLSNNPPERLIRAGITIIKQGEGLYTAEANADNGRYATTEFTAETARNREKAAEGLKASFGKKSGIFAFRLEGLPERELPFLPSSTANSIRRTLATMLDTPAVKPDMTPSIPWNRVCGNVIPPVQTRQLNCSNSLSKSLYMDIGIEPDTAYELDPKSQVELMRCKYCIRYETGRCPKQKHDEKASPLYLVNNGKRLKAVFDCARCEMVILPA